jgi:transcriptional regulator with XRE-family HTH domain
MSGTSSAAVLFRSALGEVLRGVRMQRSMTLRELSAGARVSLGYISEIERGQKEASSELLAALCEALDVALSDVLRRVSDQVEAREIERRVREVVSVPAIGVGARPRRGDVVASAA